MQQILNVYCNEEKVVRASKENGNPVLYDCFSFKVIAGTEPLSGTLPDRVIRLDMEHNVRAVPVEIDGPEIEDIRRQLEYYKVQHELEVTRAKIGQMAGISLSNI